MLRRDDARVQAVAGIRGGHATGALLAVERQRIGAEVVAPERLLETHLQRRRARPPARRQVRLATRRRQHRRANPGGVRVALYLAERDRRRGELPVGVEDRVLRILPSLVQQAVPAATAVFDEAV